MKILAIETSCDETAIAVVEGTGDEHAASFTVRGDALLSQIEIHKEYGGVYPSLAKREHAKNLVPLLRAALEEAELLHEDTRSIPNETREKVAELLAREGGLADAFFEFASECEVPNVDAIAVTAGPGLEPALWVGISFAKALALLWEKPLVPVNHMEGHILSALATKGAEGALLQIRDVRLPVLALLISGGHTELILMKEWLSYERLGQTRDDAVGEAFDKAARMLGLPYPGGPEISKLAEQARKSDFAEKGLPRATASGMSKFSAENYAYPSQAESDFRLPRPMIDSKTCDFSFAGLKTAVLYLLKDRGELSDEEKRHLAREFEDAVAEVLWKKTSQALQQSEAKTLVVGGGVSANTHIRRTFAENMAREFPETTLFIPDASLTTDNAVMIALAAYFRALRKEFASEIRANGSLSLA